MIVLVFKIISYFANADANTYTELLIHTGVVANLIMLEKKKEIDFSTINEYPWYVGVTQ